MNYESDSKALQSAQTLQQARGQGRTDKVIRGQGSTGSASERRLVVSWRMAPGYQLNEFGRKHLQHVLTDWFPQAIYGDLTAETVRVDVVVRACSMNRHVYTAAFLKGDGSVAKTIDYAEGRLIGAKCPSYDKERSGYCGTRGEDHFRLAIYNTNAG